MNRPALLLILCSLFAASAVHAEDARNAGYLEIGGSGVTLTVNYERRVTPQGYLRVGFSDIQSSSSSGTDTTYVFPVTFSQVTRPQSNHHAEFGGGVTIVTGDRQDFYDFGDNKSYNAVAVTGIAGYRYEKPRGGFQFRAVFTPIYVGGSVEPWGGVSFGYGW